jgi:hypothetical protein
VIVQPHRCDDDCTCPVHGTPLLYAPASNEHACQDPDCEHAHGFDQLKTRILAMAKTPSGSGLAAFLRPERERAERPIREYIAFADELGISRETAQRVLTSQPTYAEARLALRVIAFAATTTPPGVDPVNPVSPG